MEIIGWIIGYLLLGLLAAVVFAYYMSNMDMIYLIVWLFWPIFVLIGLAKLLDSIPQWIASRLEKEEK